MPAQELAFRRQKAVLWNKVGIDAYGQSVVSPTPIQLNVRWDGTRKEVLKPDGSTQAIDATVIVDRRIAIGSYMWLGTIAQLPGSALVPEVDVMYVYTYDSVPDLKARNNYYEVQLIRLKDIHVGN